MHQFKANRTAIIRHGAFDPFSSGAAKRTYLGIHKHLSAAHELMHTLSGWSLEPLMPEDEEWEEFSKNEGYEWPANFRWEVGLVAEQAKSVADSIAPTKGRPARDDIFMALFDLAAFYEYETGKKPGFSSRPVKKPNAKGHEIHGPFVRFVHRVFSIVDQSGVPIEPSPPSTIDNAIRRFFHERKRVARLSAASVEETGD